MFIYNHFQFLDYALFSCKSRSKIARLPDVCKCLTHVVKMNAECVDSLTFSTHILVNMDDYYTRLRIFIYM